MWKKAVKNLTRHLQNNLSWRSRHTSWYCPPATPCSGPSSGRASTSRLSSLLAWWGKLTILHQLYVHWRYQAQEELVLFPCCGFILSLGDTDKNDANYCTAAIAFVANNTQDYWRKKSIQADLGAIMRLFCVTCRTLSVTTRSGSMITWSVSIPDQMGASWEVSLLPC